MKSSKFPLLVLAVCLMLAMPTLAFYKGDQSNKVSDNVPSRIIVKVKSDISFSLTRNRGGVSLSQVKSLDAISARHTLESQEFLFPEITRRDLSSALQNVLVITPSSGADIDALVEEYRNCPDVEYAEKDAIVELYSSPNDTHYQHQWYLNNTGQDHVTIDELEPCNNDDIQKLAVGTADADIDADEVFNNPPSNTVTSIVAIIDSGVDTDHPDLIDNVWVNTGEVPGNDIDDDGNGYVDDVNGWDFQGDDGNSPDSDPTDEFGHGAHCAGIVGAVTGNSMGVAGVATDVKIMALKAIAPLPLSSMAAEALIYAADNNADVVSMSFGIIGHSSVLEDACQYAYDRGVTLVAAMGNDFVEKENEPAAYPTTIGVGATNHLDEVTVFSTLGNHISVVAPGQDILSLRADLTDVVADHPSCHETNAHIYDEIYYLLDGTSMAAPVVAAVASYLHAVSPGMMPAMTQNLIEQTADGCTAPHSPFGDTLLTEFNMYSGFGRVNLNQALQSAPLTRAQISSPEAGGFYTGRIIISGIAEWDGASSYTVEYGEGSMPDHWAELNTSTIPAHLGRLATWNTLGLSGTHTIRLRVGDNHVDYVTINLGDGCLTEIAAPVEGAQISGMTDIIGSGYCDTGFDSLVIEYGSANPIVFGPGSGEVINSLTAPVMDDVLGTWSSLELDPGTYALRSAIYFHDVIVIADTITVNMIPDFSDENSIRCNTKAYASPVANYGDFDFDGVNEIVVGTVDGLAYYWPDGNSKTVGMPSVPNADFATPVAVGDINGDGLDDLVTAGGTPGAIYVFPSNETPYTLTVPIDFDDYANYLYIDESMFNIITLEDIDADSKDEIIVSLTNRGFTPQWIGVYDDDGTELWSKYTASNNRTLILAADLDGDGISEIYTVGDGDDRIEQRSHDGTVIDYANVQFNSEAVGISNFTAFDVDYDGKLEIVLTAISDNSNNYHFHALNFGLTPASGWPHETTIDKADSPTNPIFVDLDGDGYIEYFAATYSLEYSEILGYHVDGSPFLAGSDGVFHLTSEAGIINTLGAADIDGNGSIDLLAVVNPDLFRSNRLQRFMAWDVNGAVLDGYPKIIGMVEPFDLGNTDEVYRDVPTVGDWDEDGILDMFFPAINSELIITRFAGVSYDPDKVLVPSWRYDRGHTANGPTVVGEIATPVQNEVIAGTYDVIGTASGLYFDGYELEYGEGFEPTSWNPISSSTGPVVNGVLGVWDVSSLAGPYSLRLQTQENQFATRNVYVANQPVALITNLPDEITVGSIQETILSISGSAMCVDFDYAVVEYGEGVDPSVWIPIATTESPVFESEITQWVVSDLPVGTYKLRLAVHSTTGMEASDAVEIHRIEYFDGNSGWTATLTGDGGTTANYGDFDGDDVNEIVIGTSDNVYFFDLAGNPKTIGMPVFSTGDYRMPAAVGLLDGDDEDDFVIIGVSGDTATLYGVLSQDADISITLATAPYMGYFVPEGTNSPCMPQLYLKDIDGDGTDEIHYFTGGGIQSTEREYHIYDSDGSSWAGLDSVQFPPFDLQTFPADIDGDSVCEVYASGFTGTAFELQQYDLQGNLTNTFTLPTSTTPTSYSAVDMTGDGICELLVLASQGYTGGELYVFDDSLGVIAGWPISIQYGGYMQHPVLADIDGDGSDEICAALNWANHIQIMAWNLDGSSYVDGAAGVFAVPENAATLNAPVLSDADADGVVDIILSANRSDDNAYFAERLLAYNGGAALLADYPIFTSSDTRAYDRNLHVPIVGDLNDDGMFDILTVSAEQKLMFTNFSDRAYDADLPQVPMWRYNRRLNNTVEPTEELQSWVCGDANGDSVVSMVDVQFLIAYVYQQGSAPVPLESGDANGDCAINILDIQYLIAHVVHGGPDPECDCTPVIPPGGRIPNPLKPTGGTQVGSAFCEETDGVYTIAVKSEIPLGALHLEVAGADDTKLSSTISGVQIHGSLVDGEGAIGVFDLTGKAQIGTGNKVVIGMSGELEIRSAFACDLEGNPVSLTIGSKGGELGLPEHFALGQNYPNPFNPSTTISYDLPRASRVTLEVFNTLGQRVRTLVDKRQEAGRHQMVWDGRDEGGSKVSSGIYFYKIVTGEQIDTKKMILLK